MTVQELKEQLKKETEEKDYLSQAINAKDEEISSLKSQIEKINEEVKKLKSEVNLKENEINKLKEQSNGVDFWREKVQHCAGLMNEMFSVLGMILKSTQGLSDLAIYANAVLDEKRKEFLGGK